MKKLYPVFLLACLFVAGCNQKVKMEMEDAPPLPSEAPKGELAFLLAYHGRQPEDVGFLTNHIVERRLAGLMKDSFQVLSTKTAYSAPIMVMPEAGFVGAKYFNDKERQDLSAMIIIDTRNDVFWVYYYNGETMVKFTDTPSANAPGMP